MSKISESTGYKRNVLLALFLLVVIVVVVVAFLVVSTRHTYYPEESHEISSMLVVFSGIKSALSDGEESLPELLETINVSEFDVAVTKKNEILMKGLHVALVFKIEDSGLNEWRYTVFTFDEKATVRLNSLRKAEGR